MQRDPAKPLNDAQIGGVDCFMSLQNFQKPPLTHQQHLKLLLSRGLIIENNLQAINYLEYVGYYRLSGYFHFFYADQIKDMHCFKQGTNFDMVVNLYEFDTELRALLLKAIAKIEVAARIVISNTMCDEYGAHWYLQKELFKSTFRHDKFLEQVKAETEFVSKGGRKLIFKAYYSKYKNPQLPASWMIFEALSFGTLSRIYEYIRRADLKKKVSSKFALPHYDVFSSWLQAISVTRNLCAHHSMLCYRNFHIMPRKPLTWNMDKQRLFSEAKGIYLQLIIIQHLLNVVAPEFKLKPHFEKLIKKYPGIVLEKMGFVCNWELEFVHNAQRELEACLI